jgi:hypothetical protein
MSFLFFEQKEKMKRVEKLTLDELEELAQIVQTELHRRRIMLKRERARKKCKPSSFRRGSELDSYPEYVTII